MNSSGNPRVFVEFTRKRHLDQHHTHKGTAVSSTRVSTDVIGHENTKLLAPVLFSLDSEPGWSAFSSAVSILEGSTHLRIKNETIRRAK